MVPEQTDHADLVSAAQAGDSRAFEELVRATYTDVYALAYRLTGNEEDARDVVQEAYLRAFKGLKRFREEAQFSTWMYRITANCASTAMTKGKKHRHEELEAEVSLADARPEHDPEAAGDAEILRSRLNAALAPVAAVLPVAALHLVPMSRPGICLSKTEQKCRGALRNLGGPLPSDDGLFV